MHKNPFNAISLLFFLSIITFSPACFAQPTEDPDTIHSFQLRSNTFSIANGLADEQLPSQVIDLYFLRNLTMISIPIHSSETRILLDSNGAKEDERVIRRWIKHRYYVNQNDQSKGFYYDSLNGGLTKKFFVDTFVKDRCSFGFGLDLKNYIFKEDTVHKNGDLLKNTLTEGLRGTRFCLLLLRNFGTQPQLFPRKKYGPGKKQEIIPGRLHL
jgi:hypothetical protein